MARVDIVIPEPTPVYTQDNQRQVAQSLQTLKDKLNTSYQQELKNEQDAFNYFYHDHTLQKSRIQTNRHKCRQQHLHVLLM